MINFLGNDELVTKLINAVLNGQVQHGYLLYGEEGVGKKLLSRLFTSLLVCENLKEDSVCGVCDGCKMMENNSHPDIKIINKQDKKSIGTDVSRELIADVYIRPTKSKKKVYIIEEGDLLTEQAQNALLKVLEEPPEYVVIIVIAINPEKLIRTVRSRLSAEHVAPVTNDVILKYIKENYSCDDSLADFIIKFSEGVIGRANDILSSEDFAHFRNKVFGEAIKIVSSDKTIIYEFAKMFEKQDVKMLCKICISAFRDVLVLKLGGKETIVNEDKYDIIEKISHLISAKQALFIIECFLDLYDQLLKYVNTKAALISLVAKIQEEVYGRNNRR